MSATPLRPTPQAQAEAAAWIARLHADTRQAEDERAFKAWLAEPMHAAAFEALTAVWDLSGGVKRQWVDSGVDSVEAAGSALLTRRSVLASIGAVVAAGSSLSVWRYAYAGVYETEVGEQKHVSLADGTQVFLDTDTRIQARVGERERLVALQRGRANFRVRQDALRPFVVAAAERRIVSSEATFDVRRDGDVLSVVLTHGRLSVLGGEEQDQAMADAKVLLPGQQLLASPAAMRVDSPDLAPLLAWQAGRAMFEGATLASAAAEMNRYSLVKIEVLDPAVRRLRLSGIYRVGDNDAFARSVSRLLPVTAHRSGERIEIVADRSR